MPRKDSGFNRRRFLKYSGASATALGLAGCQSLTGTSGSGKKGTIKIGGLFPEPNGLGETVVKSAELATKVMNNNGGIDGKDVEFEFGDTTAGPAAARREYERITTQEGADVTVGAFELGIKAIMPSIAEQEKLHFSTMSVTEMPSRLVSKQVSPIGGDPEEEYEKYKYHFRPGPMNLTEMLDGFMEFMELYAPQYGWETISILAENVMPRVSDEVENMERMLTDNGFDVPVAQTVSTGIDDWTPIYDDIESQGTDVCMAVSILTGIPMVKQWAAQERQFDLGGAMIWAMFPWFWEETGGAAEGVFTANAITPQTRNTPYTQTFVDNYQEEYGANSLPIFAGPITYDAMRGIKYVVEETGTMDEEELVPYLEDEYHYTESSIIHDHAFRGPDKEFAHDLIWDCMEDCEGEVDNGSPHGPTGVPLWQQWQAADDGNGGVMESFAPDIDGFKSADYAAAPHMR